jgi:ribosome-associated protein
VKELAGQAQVSAALPSAREAAVAAARAASEKKATDIRILEVRELIVITDYFVIASGSTERQVRTIIDAVESGLTSLGYRAIRREGEQEGRWVLLDFGDVVVHVFVNEERDFYELERLWKDAPSIEWSTGSSETETGGSSTNSGSASSTAIGRRRAARG